MKKTIVLGIVLLFLAACKEPPTPPVVLPTSEQISNNKIVGTLLSTSTADQLVIIVAGSGPTDRNGNNTSGLNTDMYKQLADSLIASNIATFRYDKRGISASAAAVTNPSLVTIDDFAADVTNWVNLFQKNTKWKSIYIIGHSEGSLLGILAAQKTKITGFVSLAGAGQNISQIILKQNEVAGASKAQLEEIKSKFDSLQKGFTLKYVPDYLNSLFHPDIQLLIKSWDAYHPSTELKKITCKVAIFQGTNDAQIAVSEAQLLRNAQPNANFALLKDMTHTLKIGDNTYNNTTYTDSKIPLSKELVREIRNFLGQ